MAPSTAHRLHPSYAFAWAFHVLWGAVMLAVRPPIWVLWVHLVYFGIVEGLGAAARGKPGDTLSEFMQYIAGKVPMGSRVRWYQSWRALVTLLAACYSLEGGYVVAYAWGWIPMGAGVTALVFGWLCFHWLRTEKYG